MNPFKKLSLVLVGLLLCLGASAQTGFIKGKVTDASNEEIIVGATVRLTNGQGAIVDQSGSFSIEVEPGTYTVIITLMGYREFRKEVKVSAGQSASLNAKLKKKDILLDAVVISGSSYEKQIFEETSTVEVLQEYLIENNNLLDMSEAVEKVPGVQVTDGQASIRGGSGYSYGAGSRVAVLVDNVSVISGDLGEVRWKYIPTNNADKVEVVKGASSVLYGSSSMNGVINVQTGWVKEPETNVLFYQGFYGVPKREEIAWWYNGGGDTELPHYTGAMFDHRNTVGKEDRLELVVGGRITSLDSYLEEIHEYKTGFNFKSRYNHPVNNGTLQYGVNSNIMYEQNERFILFADGDTNIYRPFGGSTTSDNYWIITANPHLEWNTQKRYNHKLDLSYYSVINTERSENKFADTWALNYRYRHHFLDEKLVWINGTQGSLGFNRNADLYEGVFPINYFGAIFSQAEFKYKTLSLVGGFRYELNQVANVTLYDADSNATQLNIRERSIPVWRGGLNWRPKKFTALRFSYGLGYRFPSMAERFLRANIAVINIIPNPDLVPEAGQTIDLGIKQGFKIADWKGFVDFSMYLMNYDEFITYVIGIYPPPGRNPTVNDIGFKPFNLDEAQIGGFEFALAGSGNLGPVQFRAYGGYTYSYPADLSDSTGNADQQKLGTFLSNAVTAFGNIDALDTTNMLTYRNLHTFKMDLEGTYKRFTAGVALNMFTPYKRIDGTFIVFAELIDGIDDFVTRYNKNMFVLDARIMYNAPKNFTIGLIGRNLLNEEYSERPGTVAGPVSYTIQARYKF